MMLKVIVISALAFVASGSYSRSGGSGSGRSSSSGGGGYSSGGGGGGYSSGGGNGYSGQVIPAAIQTKHEIQFRDVPSTGDIQPATIEVGASAIPLNILFRSASSNLNVVQQHSGAGGDTQESQSEDEPHILKHQVTKPIIQEVREIITPSRKIVQEIHPVQEEILTIVAKGEQRQSEFGGGYGGISSGGSLGLGGSIGGGISLGIGSSSSSGSSGSSSPNEIKATSGSGLGKGLAGKTAGGYASSAKASSGGTKGY